MHTIHHSDARGLTLTTVYLCDEAWKALPTNTIVPDSSKLFNFDVKAKAGKTTRTFLVLDNYGDEVLPRDVLKRLLHMDMLGYNLAIDRSDGILYTAQFLSEKPNISLAVARLTHGRNLEPMQVPRKFLKRIDELKNKKRPYYVSCWEPSVWAFLEKEEGFACLRESLLVDLHFDQRRVQVWGDSYREVTDWSR